MYKLLALDMEDTFLDSNKTILPSVEKRIRRLLHKGVDVTLASGRFPASLWLHSRFLDMKFPLVALNGGALVDPISGAAEKTFPIGPQMVMEISNFAKERGLYLQLYGYNTLFVEEVNDFNRRWPLENVVKNPDKDLTYDNYRGQVNSIRLVPVGDFTEYFKDQKAEVLKGVILDRDRKKIDDAYGIMDTWEDITISRTGDQRFDINAARVSKKTTLEYICKKRGISPQEVVAAGYFDNDLDMILWAGLGIAMGDAHPQIKGAAELVTATNDQGGVAQAIDEIFF